MLFVITTKQMSNPFTKSLLIWQHGSLTRHFPWHSFCWFLLRYVDCRFCCMTRILNATSHYKTKVLDPHGCMMNMSVEPMLHACCTDTHVHHALTRIRCASFMMKWEKLIRGRGDCHRTITSPRFVRIMPRVESRCFNNFYHNKRQLWWFIAWN